MTGPSTDTGAAEVTGPSDKELLAAHTHGDPDAFAELVRRHRDRLWAVALRTLGDREEAADALQDALVSAFRRADTFRGDAAVTTWLHRIVVNACLDRVRRQNVRPAVPLPDSDHEVPPARTPDPAEHAAMRTDVAAALATLPVEQRAALVLVDMQGYSVDDAAAILGVAPGTVKSRCARARARLVPLLAPGRRNRVGRADVPPQRPAEPAEAAGPVLAGQPTPRTDVPEGGATG